MLRRGDQGRDAQVKKMVARLNIEHFRHMLQTEMDETKRRSSN
jgi:hypothetical protein